MTAAAERCSDQVAWVDVAMAATIFGGFTVLFGTIFWLAFRSA